jgi:cation diffusion facilitator CzcD-associated flavoprotein CzcO
MSLPRTAIIGAGIAGLTAGKALGDRGIPYACFEMSDDIGGNWYFKNPNGRSSAYRSLHIDTSKECLSFEDFPMGPQYPDFPHHAEILQFLQEYAAKFALKRHIRFKTAVTKAERRDGGGWTIHYEGPDGPGREDFDALLVCNGHHWDASVPNPPYPGTFTGRQIHSHDYIDPQDPLDLRGQRVLVVGIGNSAVDIVCELSRKGVADKVYIATRSGAWVMPKYVFGKPLDQLVRTNPYLPQGLQRWVAGLLQRLVSGKPEDFGLPTPNHKFLEAHPTVSSELLLRLGSGDARAKPNVKGFDGKRVLFEDGTGAEVDTIIWATGYRVTFPFFDKDFISAPDNRLPLWKRMWKPGIPDLAFIGLAQVIPTLFPFVELQAKVAAQWLEGTFALPTESEMLGEIARDDERNVGHYGRRQRHTMQLDYYLYRHEMTKKVVPAGLKRAHTHKKQGPVSGALRTSETQ